MTTYYSVDVETSGLSVFEHDLLSFGVAVVKDLQIVATMHVALEVPFINWDSSTYDWWQEHPEAYCLTRENQINRALAVEKLTDFVLDYESVKDERVFVASPTSFDYPWIAELYRWIDLTQGLKVENPFPHRHLDLRSAIWGLSFDLGWNVDRSLWQEFDTDPVIPHYALDDAVAQAQSLIKVMKYREDWTKVG